MKVLGSMLLTAVAVLGVRADNPLIRIMPLGDSITWGYDQSDPVTYPGVTQTQGGYRVKLYDKLVAAGYNVAFCGSQTGNNPSDAPAAAQRHEGYCGYTISRTFYAAYDPTSQYGGVLEQIPVSFKTAENPHVILLHLGSNVGSMGNVAAISAGLGMNGAETLTRYGLRDLSRLLDALSEKQPGAEIIVTTLLDRDHLRNGTDTAQPGVVAFNAGLPALVDEHVAKGQKVHLFDMNPLVPLADMPDGVHPNETGYAKMADGWFTAITNLIPDAATFVPDNTPGIVANTYAGTTATIWYNQAMGASAGTLANYMLGKPSIAVTAAALDGGDARQVNLTLAAALPADETVEVFAENVTNAAESAAATRCTAALVDLSTNDMVCAGGAGRIAGDPRILFVYRQNGTVVIPRAGTVEVLLVGGGGGGGVRTSADQMQAAGGGGGGVVYKKAIRVAAGTYAVTVGAGGAIGANGGNSSVFGLTAYGGGAGANGITYNKNSTASKVGGSGASGGGSATANPPIATGGAAIYASADNFGHAGGPSEAVYGGGGGGGAGAPGATIAYNNKGIEDNGIPRNGGDGILIPMLGPNEYYGGGGAGVRKGVTYVSGGKGGGGGFEQAGEDGRGGGGCGGSPGGSGLVAISYAAAALADVVPADSDDFAVTGGDETVPLLDGTARIFRNDGTLTVTGSGYLELLVVGGGGGGGERGNDCSSGGGGAGGVVHVTSMPVAAGDYAVTIGAGGGVNTNGGNSAAFGRIAFGGGAGAPAGAYPGSDGASGGGAAVSYWNKNLKSGGSAIRYSVYRNLGHAGGSSANTQYGAGGGGGAGAPGKPTLNNSYPGDGGDGYRCTILGTNGWYAGGGAGTRSDGRGVIPVGGKGGGGNGVYRRDDEAKNSRAFGTAGVDGLGGGGAGGMPGGSGTVIVRYRKADYATEFRGAEGGTMSIRQGYGIHTFTESGTFTMPCVGAVEVLVVGGGGGGGLNKSATDYQGGAGGGAGGFLYTNMVLTAGAHAVTVGAGGAASMNGEASSFHLFTAYGGGAGANYNPRTGASGNVGANGASGGGSTIGWNATVTEVSGGQAIYGAEGNFGHAGGGAAHVYAAGGGGGAGAPGGDGPESTAIPGAGGAGKMCAITGSEVYYAGGGAGFRYKVNVAGGLGGGGSCMGTAGGEPGTDGLGGGGCGGQKGGSGVVIIRYKLKPIGTIITVR